MGDLTRLVDPRSPHNYYIIYIYVCVCVKGVWSVRWKKEWLDDR